MRTSPDGPASHGPASDGPASTPDRKGHGPAQKALLASAAFGTLLSILVVATGALPFGAPSVWTWQRLPLEAPTRALFALVPLALVAAILLGAGRALLGHEALGRGQEAGALGALWLAAFATANAIVLMHPMGWAYPTTLVVNPASNSYFSTALSHPDTSALLRDYPRQMKGFVSHAQTQSAGPVAFSGAATRLAKASPFSSVITVVTDTLLALSPGTNADEVASFCRRWEPRFSADDARAALFVALSMMAVGSLAVVPLYFAGKWLDSPGAGLFAALAFVLLPSFSLFSPSVDQMYPLVSAAALCGVWRGLRAAESGTQKPAMLWLALSGAGLGAGLFFNMGLIVAVALCGIFALFGARARGRKWQQIAPGAAAFALGVLLSPVLMYLVLGYDLWSVFLTSNGLRDSLYYNARSHPASLWANLLDFFAFCGLPAFALWAWHTWQLWKERSEPREPRELRSLAPALALALVVTLLLLDASGRVRGEAARMWMFLSPPVLIGAGIAWLALWRQSRSSGAVLLALQTAQLAAFNYFVRVWGY